MTYNYMRSIFMGCDLFLLSYFVISMYVFLRPEFLPVPCIFSYSGIREVMSMLLLSVNGSIYSLATT